MGLQAWLQHRREQKQLKSQLEEINEKVDEFLNVHLEAIQDQKLELLTEYDDQYAAAERDPKLTQEKIGNLSKLAEAIFNAMNMDNGDTA